MNFFNRLMDTTDPLSTKRFVILICLLLLIVMVIKNVFGGVQVQDELVYVVASVLTAGIGATLLEKNDSKNNNETDAKS